MVSEYLSKRTNLMGFKDPRTQNLLTDYNDLMYNSYLLKPTSTISLPDGEESGDYGHNCSETFMGQAQVALEFFANDLSRCAIVQDEGFCNMRWDSHGDYFEQNWHYDLLFLGLQQLMDELQTKTNPQGIPLIQETTIVVCSEMSRHPALNEMGGKHHWPVGSAMIINGGQGGRTIGGYNSQVLGRPLDLETGDVFEGGIKLKPQHLGATLLAMADLDPLDFGNASPILGAL